MYETFLAKADFVGTGVELPYTVLIGLAAVFSGLICIVLLCKIVGMICGNAKKGEPATTEVAPVATAVTAAPQPIENRQQIIAAVSAAVAEELGTDVSAIRILSFKKI